MRTCASISTAAARAARLDKPLWRRSGSATCSPAVITGLSANFGSCRMSPARRPRMAPRARGEAESTSISSKRSRFARSTALGGVRRRIARAVSDLPDPDSPTMPSVSAPMAKLTPRTAGAKPLGPGNPVWRSSISSCISSARFRIEHVAQPVSQEVEGEGGDENGDARGGWHPPLLENVVARGRDHRAPFAGGRLRAHAEESEPGRGDDDAGHVEADAHDDAGESERNDVAKDDAAGAGSREADRGDEIGIADGERIRAREPRIGRPGGERDRDDGAADAGLQGGNEGEGQDEPRKGEENVGEAHQDAVGQAAEVAGDAADEEPERRHQHDDGDDHA